MIKIKRQNIAYKLSISTNLKRPTNRKFFQRDLSRLQEHYKISNTEIINLLQKKILVPVSIFSYETSPLESLVKYLKENYLLKMGQIALLLNRDPRTVWFTYNAALKKIKEPFPKKKHDYYIDMNKFSDRSYSILEIVCNNLSELSYSITNIAVILNKHRNTVWTALNRYKNKHIG